MDSKARAFAPANLSCIFKICPGSSPEDASSLGVGITLDSGAVATVRSATRFRISVNGKKRDFPTVETVVRNLTTHPVDVSINAALPYGAGFGMSGASALATALALDAALGLNRSREELAMAAHVAEVENGTGLGDVCGQIVGGFRIRRKMGHPLESEPLDIHRDHLYFRIFGTLETKTIIADSGKIRHINEAGDRALRKISKCEPMELPDLIKISFQFARESGLLVSDRVSGSIEEIQKAGGNASMVMLGESVFADTPFPGCQTGTIGKTGATVLDYSDKQA